ncbi:MAG: ribosome silencing factor, partial [Actinomycetaceae bacterium]|nr:ribosome silencing factor [Actinomycetaceae bacterium]
SASSQRQIKAIVKAVDEAAHSVGVKMKHREGLGDDMHWVLLDYGDLIVHIFHDDERDVYALDKLWGDCPLIDLECDFSDTGEPEPSLASYALFGSES